MFHFPEWASYAYGFSARYHGIPRGELPHSGILGSRPAGGSPRLIAACYALLRLLMPGHPPYTLSSLTKFAPDTHCLLHVILQRSIQLSKNGPEMIAQGKAQARTNVLSEFVGGAERDRTADPLLAKQVLSQLSYSPSPMTDLPEKAGQVGLTAYARERFFQYMLPPCRNSARRQ